MVVLVSLSAGGDAWCLYLPAVMPGASVCRVHIPARIPSGACGTALSAAGALAWKGVFRVFEVGRVEFGYQQVRDTGWGGTRRRDAKRKH